MREILFRGKTKQGEWIYGDLITHGIDFDDAIKQHHTREIWDIIPETVGQFTGLTDKNGKKIFEGDIIKADFDYKKEPMEVIYYKCGFKLKSKDCKEIYDYSIHDETPELEVIGNIHDNKELLGE